MSVRLWLVRHTTTDQVEAGRFNGWEDVPLNQRGRSEAASLRIPERKWVGVWSSDLTRALETARFAGFAPMMDPRLRELHFGLLEGMAWDELEQATQTSLVEFDDFVAPRGESVAQLRERVGSFVADLNAGDHLIFTHGGVIRLLLRAAGRDEHVPASHSVDIEMPLRARNEAGADIEQLMSRSRPCADSPNSSLGRRCAIDAEGPSCSPGGLSALTTLLFWCGVL
jgi:2,3-bisphosphoglycerate-dependent phosphoglycerate mutase